MFNHYFQGVHASSKTPSLLLKTTFENDQIFKKKKCEVRLKCLSNNEKSDSVKLTQNSTFGEKKNEILKQKKINDLLK